ncbi:hypothetical protein DYB37_012547 [Aphanomyces astaci]|uniref:Uncharacterized protein n=1 Tax=Aphanomyces astaci TaxID=112090 RepID=A0A3R7EXD4_APHAT|nr:hypothetical protein DYB37_012547 [Aphanomyces astaci]
MSPSPPPAAATASQRSRRNVTARSINHAVDLLNNLQAKRDSKRQRHSQTLRDDDTDHDSPAPVLDAFIQAKGPNVVHQMTNFSLSEFNVLWSDLQSTVNRRWNTGSGRKCDVTGRDMLFMAVTSMKHCGTWDVVATMFAAASPTFSKRVITFLEAIHPHLKTNNMRRVHKAKHADPTAPTAAALDGAVRHFERARDNAVKAIDSLSSSVANVADVATSTSSLPDRTALIAQTVDDFVKYLVTRFDVSNLEGLTSLAKAFVFHPSEKSPQVDAFVANGLDVVLHARRCAAQGVPGTLVVLPATADEALESLTDGQIEFLQLKVAQVKRDRRAVAEGKPHAVGAGGSVPVKPNRKIPKVTKVPRPSQVLA